MKFIFTVHSILIGIAVSALIDAGRYGIAAGVFSTAVIQILWSIDQK